MLGVSLILSFLFLFASRPAVVAVTDGLLSNGAFEQGPKPWQMKGSQVVGQQSLPHWEISGYVEYIKSGQKQGDMLLVVPEGSHAVRLGNDASIKQRVQMVKGTYYSLTFSAARTCAQQEKLNVSASPEFGVLPIQTMYSSNGWDSYAWAWRAKSDIVDIVIHNTGVDEDPGCGPLIDSVAIKKLDQPTRTNKNLLKNGDFEEGPYIISKTNWGVLIPPNIEDDHCPIPGWTVVSLKAVKYLDSDHFFVPNGARAIELVGGRESAILQVVRTTVGHTYALTFAVGDAKNGCKGSMQVEAYAGSEHAKVPFQSKGTGAFKRGILQFTAKSSRTRVVFFSSFYHTRSDDLSSLCGPVVDDVALVGVRNVKHLL